jgi:hypothetical protein
MENLGSAVSNRQQEPRSRKRRFRRTPAGPRRRPAPSAPGPGRQGGRHEPGQHFSGEEGVPPSPPVSSRVVFPKRSRDRMSWSSSAGSEERTNFRLFVLPETSRVMRHSRT